MKSPSTHSIKIFVLSGLVAASLSACLGGGGGEDAAALRIAAADIKIPVNARTVAAINGDTFEFPAGIADAGTGFTVSGPTVVTLNNNGSFSMHSANDGDFGGELSFGSCIFKVTSAPAGSPYLGKTLEINVCDISAATGGVLATGQATAVQILLALGQSTSKKRQAQVVIDPNSGVVTVNGVQGGSITLSAVTGTGTGTGTQ